MIRSIFLLCFWIIFSVIFIHCIADLPADKFFMALISNLILLNLERICNKGG